MQKSQANYAQANEIWQHPGLISYLCWKTNRPMSVSLQDS